ncbi:NAD(P)-dependent oxidoreductase [Flavobacterium sp. PL02]|jgi:putative NADH-flavin reductase|uniref:NAD(P)-dependent oxidoreductase n=1 Tax=Flavobacterium sp. PL02 TaxID=3088354 RepID=UPI002B239FDC|nr:NAD(P)H-binding protein [Flavobacterium sp. PL02]MEA9415242.1 NAD(P)H-binding protein [Flavobacterium sp. PL02]
MKNIIKVAVLGGGGRTGKYVVDQLLNKGFGVKLLLRNPENLQNTNPLVEVVKGDAIDAHSIQVLLKGCQAVISTIGQRQGEPLVASEATINVLKAMNEFGIQRYVLLAGLNIDTPFDKKGEKTIQATEWMKANFPVIQEDRQKTYNLLVESNANWTLVRVPFIEFTDASAEIAVSLEDCLGDKINATDIAGFMVDQIFDDKFIKQSPFIANI